MALCKLFKQLELMYAKHACKLIEYDVDQMSSTMQNDLINQGIIIWC